MPERVIYFNGDYFLTDGGLETTLVFHKGINLRHFAAFELLNNKEGQQVLIYYYEKYLALAEKYSLGFIFETPTWRANSDWGFRLGYSHDELIAVNKKSVTFARNLVKEWKPGINPILISGNIGPRGDGYKADNRMTPEQAKAYHFDQIQAFATADADAVSALTINYSDEAIGIVQAAELFHIPVVISFTVETDGRLPNGETLRSAIEKTDETTGGYAEHFMVNCAHPLHFKHVFEDRGEWASRIKGIRANASTKSHAELDASETLDTGDCNHLAEGYAELKRFLPELRVIGGCCGTDLSHIKAIADKLFENKTIFQR